MASTSWGYRAALRIGTAVAPLLSGVSLKFKVGDQGRRAAGDRLLEWARWNRDSSRPLAWFHAASMGEGLQAEAVIQRLRRRRPDCQVLYTFFSPSAEVFARRLDVDVADYLPYDLPDPMQRLLASLQPDLLVFAKLDVWPELSTMAATTGAQVALVAATVRPGSARLRWPARALLHAGYQVVSLAAAISAEDAARLTKLGVPPDRIEVLGDPRFDSVDEKVRAIKRDDPLLRFGQGAPTLVAGSTWPEDEAVLLGAYARVRQRNPNARLILVPHEPGPEHLKAVERRAEALGLPMPVRLSAADGPATFLLVDQIGVLAALYGSGTMAYVGGGFGSAGLHSVLEPAAWEIPVTFGPRWTNSRDAMLLLEANGGAALTQTVRGKSIAELGRYWEGWIQDADRRRAQGKCAREVVERGLGAAERNAELLARLISGRPLRTSPHGARSSPPSAR